MYYGMYYDKKEGKLKKLSKLSEAKSSSAGDDKKEEKAFLLLKSLKDQNMDNRQYAQMREDYYRALGDQN